MEDAGNGNTGFIQRSKRRMGGFMRSTPRICKLLRDYRVIHCIRNTVRLMERRRAIIKINHTTYPSDYFPDIFTAVLSAPWTVRVYTS